MLKYLLLVNLFAIYSTAYCELVGGRLNAFSGGDNAFAGIVNPANAVWIPDRFDVGAYWVYQKSGITNYDDNPGFLPGKTDLTHKARNLLTWDAAIHKHVPLKIDSQTIDTSISLAVYTQPTYLKLRTKSPIPAFGTTPMSVMNRTDVISTVLSFKICESHSIGIGVDYLRYSHRRYGYQNSDNSARSVSPGNVTNNGTDHSSGIGFTLGWRWKITDNLFFGTAWTDKSYCGRYRKYQGFESHHAENYSPQLLGAGFSYRFTEKLGGRLEVLWMNLGNLPSENNSILPDGSVNKHKRGSKKGPGPGTRDATFINLGMGYKINSLISVGAGYSHRLKLPRNSPYFISHSYAIQTIYNIVSLGANFTYEKYNLFLGATHGFRNKVTGVLPMELGGGRFAGQKENSTLSISTGYMY